MANNGVEIEIKIPVEESTFLKVKEQLKSTAKFVKSQQELDEYFTPSHRNFVSPQFPYEWLRLRKKGSSAIITYKHFHPENVEKTTHCDEFESKIENDEQLQKILKALDFKKLVSVDKTRETCHYKDEFEIALDSVKELGNFIEIESLKDFGGISLTREKLFELANQLGLDTSNCDLRGYPFMLLKKKGLLK